VRSARLAWSGRPLGLPRLPHPDEDPATFIAGDLLGVDELILEPFEVRVIEGEAQHERARGDPTLALQQVDDLGQKLIKRHTCPSTSARGPPPGVVISTSPLRSESWHHLCPEELEGF